MKRETQRSWTLGVIALVASIVALPIDVGAAELDRCVEHVIGSGARADGVVLHESAHFLFPRKQVGESWTSSSESCVTFLAFGGGQIRDLDLYLYGAEGQLLAEDRRTAAHALLRHCVGIDDRVHLALKMSEGIGEVRLLVLRKKLRDASIRRALDQCLPPQGQETWTAAPRPNVGRIPPTDLAHNLSRMHQQLEELGFQALEPPTQLEVGPAAPGQRFLLVRKGFCYAVALAGGASAHDLDLAVIRGRDTEIVRDAGPSRDAWVTFCAIENGVYRIVYRAQRGEGKAALARYMLRPKVLGESALIGQAAWNQHRVLLELERRSLQPQHLAWGFSRLGIALNHAVSVRAGRCYAFAAIADDPVNSPPMALSLLDEDGALVARDARPGAPVLFHCPRFSGVMRLRAVEGRAGRMRLIVGVGS